jgi:hypothetical protein
MWEIVHLVGFHYKKDDVRLGVGKGYLFKPACQDNIKMDIMEAMCGIDILFFRLHVGSSGGILWTG